MNPNFTRKMREINNISREFRDKLFALLREYDVEMEINNDIPEGGITFFAYAKYNEEGDIYQECINFSVGDWEDGSDDKTGSVESTNLFSVGSRRWWPNCAKCGKTVDHAEVIGGPSAVKRYRVRCHGQEEDHLIGIWAALEYSRKGVGLPDSFTANEKAEDHD